MYVIEVRFVGNTLPKKQLGGITPFFYFYGNMLAGSVGNKDFQHETYTAKIILHKHQLIVQSCN